MAGDMYFQFFQAGIAQDLFLVFEVLFYAGIAETDTTTVVRLAMRLPILRNRIVSAAPGQAPATLATLWSSLSATSGSISSMTLGNFVVSGSGIGFSVSCFFYIKKLTRAVLFLDIHRLLQLFRVSTNYDAFCFVERPTFIRFNVLC